MKQLVSILVMISILLLGSVPVACAGQDGEKQQRAVLITGASTGIGRKIAEDLAGMGFHVYAGARKQKDLDALNAIENIQAVSEKAHGQKAFSITAFSEALAYGLLKSPGSQGADIVCGEGQSLGIPQSFGGPGLGMFASLNKYVRNMPGRLIGKAKDVDGKDGFVLTLATREQHIRREKATSNICSNQGLCATMATMYMATVGRTGIGEIARQNHDKAEYLKSELKKAGLEIPFDRPTFNEFVVKCPEGFAAKYRELAGKKIVAGIPLDCHYPELTDHYLLCATETTRKADMDARVKEVTS